MSDAQVWSIIGVLAATLVSMVVGMFSLFSRTLKAEFNAFRGEIGGEFSGVRAEFSGVRAEFGVVRAEFGVVRAEISGLRGEMGARFDAVNTRLDATDRRIDGLDRDVQTVFNRLFGTHRDEL